MSGLRGWAGRSTNDLWTPYKHLTHYRKLYWSACSLHGSFSPDLLGTTSAQFHPAVKHVEQQIDCVLRAQIQAQRELSAMGSQMKMSTLQQIHQQIRDFLTEWEETKALHRLPDSPTEEHLAYLSTKELDQATKLWQGGASIINARLQSRKSSAHQRVRVETLPDLTQRRRYRLDHWQTTKRPYLTLLACLDVSPSTFQLLASPIGTTRVCWKSMDDGRRQAVDGSNWRRTTCKLEHHRTVGA